MTEMWKEGSAVIFSSLYSPDHDILPDTPLAAAKVKERNSISLTAAAATLADPFGKARL